MFRLVRLVLPLLLVSACALAQGNPNLLNGQTPTGPQWNSYFSAKVDVFSGTLNSPTINNPNVTGVFTVNGNTIGTAAFATLGSSGNAVPLLNGVNTWSGPNHFGSNTIDGSSLIFTGGTLAGLTFSGGAMSGTFTGALNIVNTSVGALTTDQAQINSQLNGTSSGAQIYQMIIGCSLCFNADAVRGVATATSGTTNSNTNGIAGYVLNQNPTGGFGQNAVAVFGVGIGVPNNSQTWGINVNLTDNITQVVSAGTGKFLNNEYDFNVTSPNTSVNGLILQGASASQPFQANGFVVNNLRLGTFAVPWSNAFFSAHGGATTALFVGTLGNPATASASSQAVAFVSTNASSVQQVTSIFATTAGLTLNRGTLTLSGGLPSGTAASYACFTAGGVLISQVAACP